ncbi:hypothetical protein Cfor_00240 [Coptotermes formosanus]|uniref:Transcription factor CBF/NF-Y/archaeal histone domain-containing protein n=1 Tax=Coptotermes formosanus TaxID=36987 RepID=A0A6L2PF19_COPFO|nr:hypothetical protein Cfor_00240 [Coptotermes formosanus]
MEITSTKNAKTLTPSHMKQCILSESRFDFLKDLVISLPDVATCDCDDGAVQPNAISDGKLDTASSGTWQRQEGTSISSNRDGKGCMPPSAEPTAVSSNKMNLNFYKESEEANISGTENFCQHAAARRSLSYGQDAEDSGSENEGEYQVPAIVPQYTQPKASAVVDEDYDT